MQGNVRLRQGATADRHFGNDDFGILRVGIVVDGQILVPVDVLVGDVLAVDGDGGRFIRAAEQVRNAGNAARGHLVEFVGGVFAAIVAAFAPGTVADGVIVVPEGLPGNDSAGVAGIVAPAPDGVCDFAPNVVAVYVHGSLRPQMRDLG